MGTSPAAFEARREQLLRNARRVRVGAALIGLAAVAGGVYAVIAGDGLSAAAMAFALVAALFVRWDNGVVIRMLDAWPGARQTGGPPRRP